MKDRTSPGKTLLVAFVVSVLSATLAFTSEDQPPLIAAWDFDQTSGRVFRDISGNGHDASFGGSPAHTVTTAPGVFGDAVNLAGRHRLPISQRIVSGPRAEISLSAWVLPIELSGYREIFRKEDGDRRVLFSFQHSGTILSLGLNIGGYVECDAKVDPAELVDGTWHHAAASFDGKFLRVYLDGREVGSLHRPGKITSGGSAPAFIGSSGGGGEFFQGAIDALEIYARALTHEQILARYKAGGEVLRAHGKAIDRELDALYPTAGTFAETLTVCREKLADKGGRVDRRLLAGLLTRLKFNFPEDYKNFLQWSDVSLVNYLAQPETDVDQRVAARLIDLLIEYRPVTDEQWRCVSPAEAARWKETAEWERRFKNLKAQGSAARYSPDWVELILAAGSRVQHRPKRHEAVAPYVRPETPKTRDHSSAEATQILRRDWLHQAGAKPSAARVQKEITWARELAGRIAAQFPGRVDFHAQLARLDQLAAQAATATAFDRELYFAVRKIKRGITFKNPVIDFGRVLFVDMPFPQGSEWRHETRHRLGYMAVPGARLLVLDGLGPDGSLTQLMPRAPLAGSFWRPDLSYDGKKVLVCFKPHNEKSFHLYEVGVDGSGLTQLTRGPYDDLDPIYLPDEKHILFSTTRGHTYVRCMPPTNAFVLARCDRRGDDIYLISRNNEPDYLPSVLNDGRIIYTRWEYTDKPLWRAQSLWTVHPDGTRVNTFWGNQSVWPDLLKDARSIPGSSRVMFTGSAHHDWFSGSVGIIDSAKGLNFPDGLTKVTADMPWPESGNGPVDPVESPRYHSSGHYAAYYSPFPLSERDFLVSANRNGKFVLYLMDVDGNRELIWEGLHQVLHALPVRPRARPPVLPDRVEWPSKEERLKPKHGVIFSDNIYQGAPPELQGRAKHLRILTIDAKTYTYWYKRPYISTGPVVSLVQSEGVKRVLGTVPIEDDGSVAFFAPAGIPLHFQLLDENYRALQTMRSFTGVMPGEYRGCLGCHDSHNRAPQVEKPSLAFARKPPRKITPPPWGVDTVSYTRYVRPVLNKYCASCHEGEGEARKVLDLTPRPGFLGFDKTYEILTGRPSWGRPYQAPQNPVPGWGIADMIMVEAYDQRDPKAYKTPPPMTRLSYKSRLIDLASSGKHYGVRVDNVSLRKLIVWVDTMCPYRGDEEVRALPDPEFQGIDWLAIRPRIRTAPRVVRPGPVED